MRENGIFQTTFARSASYNKQVTEALKFITENHMLCFANNELKSFILNKTQSTFHTPMSQIYNHLIDTYKSRGELPFVEIFINTKNPPEIFTYDSFSFDFETINKNLPEKLKGSVVNLTNSIKYKPTPAGNMYQADDLTKIHSLYVRAALCQSYDNCADRMWLTPQLALFIIRTYSMILTKQISVFYHINDPLLLKKFNLINTLFYGTLIDKEMKSGYSDIVFRSGIGNFTEIKEMISELNDLGFTFDKRYNIIDVCSMYKAVSGDKLTTFDFPKLFKLFSAGSVDRPFAGICLEYPPYWVHQLLALGSGSKQPTYFNIFRDSGIMKEIPAFAHQLNTTQNFIGMLG